MSGPVYYLTFQSLFQRKHIFFPTLLQISKLPSMAPLGLEQEKGSEWWLDSAHLTVTSGKLHTHWSGKFLRRTLSLLAPFSGHSLHLGRASLLDGCAQPPSFILGNLFTSSLLLQSLHPGGEDGGPLHSILSILPLLDGWVVVFKVLAF